MSDHCWTQKEFIALISGIRRAITEHDPDVPSLLGFCALGSEMLNWIHSVEKSNVELPLWLAILQESLGVMLVASFEEMKTRGVTEDIIGDVPAIYPNDQVH